MKVLVLSSSKDDKHLGGLVKHLSLLRERGAIQLWTHHAVLPGENWETSSLEAIRSADLVLLLISADFINDHFQEVELSLALERQKRGDLWVVPILIRAVDIEDTWIEGLQVLPPERRPIREWRSSDEFWTTVATGVRRLVPAVRQLRIGTVGRIEPIGVPASMQPQRREWRNLIERILALEEAGLPEETLSVLKIRAAQLKREAREGHMLSTGEILDDRYLVLDQIGQGGFARVWKALDLRKNEEVALKVLKGDFAQDTGRRERFRVGIRAMSQLDHPGIVALKDEFREESGYVTSSGVRTGQYYYCVMEYLSGGDLQQYVKKYHPEPGRILELTCELAQALEFAHSRGYIHRDVKPANVLISVDGRAKLADFDLAKIGDSTHGTRTGSLGTVFYAAPESHQSASTRKLDARADVYSLTMTLVFGLFGAELPYDVMVDRSGLIGRLPISHAMREVILKGLQVRPEHRYPSMKAFREALERATTPPLLGADHGKDLSAEMSAPTNGRWIITGKQAGQIEGTRLGLSGLESLKLTAASALGKDSSSKRIIASNPGNLRVDLFVYTRCFPAEFRFMIMLLLLMLGLTLLNVLVEVYQTLSILVPCDLFLVGGIMIRAIDVRRFFMKGCVNPAVVVSTKPPMIAVGTDLSTGKKHRSVPAIKIVLQPMDRLRSGVPSIGTRIATVATYRGDGRKAHWDDFNPVAANCATKDGDELRRLINSIPESQWRELEEGLREIGKQIVPGLHFISAVTTTSTPSSSAD